MVWTKLKLEKVVD
jgi:hypothetical protein